MNTLDSAESSATPGDVLAVLERYAFFVKQNLKNGYDIELLGFGTLFLRFVTGKAVTDKEKTSNDDGRRGEIPRSSLLGYEM